MWIEATEGRETALDRIWVHEDSVIEHDARSIEGFSLVDSDMTGWALFESGDVRLEVITANKRPLEEVFGVDLILFNRTHGNIVMVQYKMLEASDETSEADWVYRPNQQLDDELSRMRDFSADLAVAPTDYRLNSDVFYLKFVKRDGSLRKGSVITPVSHFNLLRSDPGARGPRNGFRVSYDSLGGRYLREKPFLSLVSAGYIGGHAATTAQLKPIIDAILAGNTALVACIKSSRSDRQQ